ncbi:hypothetical protein H6L08_11660 [Staphylococcus epidermidis]|nr:hypothetical protein [Staphylococcus epidermidis]
MKKKVITILAGAVLLSPISAALPNNIHTPQINKEASAKSKYKLESVKKYHYVPKKKASGPSGDMSGYNMGYYVIKVYNQKTGKKVSSKTIPIQRA